MVYDVYAGGIHAVQANVIMDLREKNRYKLVLEAHTRGFLGKVAPWQGIFESEGWIKKDGSFQVELHRSEASWRGELETKDYKYNRDGSFDGLYITEHKKERYKKDIESDLTDGTTDILTATLDLLLSMENGGSCNSTNEIFDGKRSFEMTFKQKQETGLKASRYNIYDGWAAECSVEVTPVAGAWHKKPRGWMSIQEQGRKKGYLPTMWIGITEDVVAVPAKIQVKTDYGTLLMHLSEFEYAGEISTSDKRADNENNDAQN